MQRFIPENARSSRYTGRLMQNASAISKNFAKFLPKWSQVEIKLFFCLLENINWRSANNGNVVCMKTTDLMERLAWKPDSKCDAFYKYVVKRLRHMSTTCEIYLERVEDKYGYVWGKLFYHVEGDEEEVAVVFNERFMPYFEDLICSKNYYIYWLADIYSFKSRHAQYLYLDLIAKSKCFGRDFDTVDYTIRQLKTVFGMRKEDYVNKSTGHFNRSMFEKRALIRAIKEINLSGLIQIVPTELGDQEALFTKSYKKNGRVDKYTLTYKVNLELLNKPREGKWWYNSAAFRTLQKKNREAVDKFNLDDVFE